MDRQGNEFKTEPGHLDFVKRIRGQALDDYEPILILYLCFETLKGTRMQTWMMRETNSRKVCARLRKSQMKTGFTILFYGPPGTGKIESVYQLARVSGREIIRVNLSETKNMWFGESEKRVKEIFDRYRTVSKNAKLTPILLLNEADSLLGKHRELGRSGVDQTENVIQNILLQ